MDGLLVVCEGLDCAGKTTTLKGMSKDMSFMYSKSLGSKTFIGKLAKRFPSTFLFALELIYLDMKFIRPALKKGKVIMQDRHYLSLRCFAPSARRWFNRKLLRFVRRAVRRPDALVYFTAPKEERIRRLKIGDNPHHQNLVKNHHLIDMIEKEYKRQYRQFLSDKTMIDTGECSKKEAVERLKGFVAELTLPSQKISPI